MQATDGHLIKRKGLVPTVSLITNVLLSLYQIRL
jgi:hypothetical protein